VKNYPVVMKWTEVDTVDADGVVRSTWAMVPQARYERVCKKQYQPGEEYPLVVLEPRSRASHNAFFAEIGSAFSNLPENIAARFPTAEHLRKWCLIETGWFDEKEFDCPDEKFAKRLGTFIRTQDDFARISVHRVGSAWKVIVRQAKSQSAQAMSKQPFEESKKDVLDLLEAMTNVPRGSFKKEAKAS
jgi:hypothetical protein